MTSKKPKAVARARPVALKPLDPQIGFDELADAYSVESVAHSMVQLIINKGADILYKHYIQDKSEAVTAVDTLDNVLSTVEFQLLPHDHGELLAADEARRQRRRVPADPTEALSPSDSDSAGDDTPRLWTAEPEPRPCDIDLWASGVIPVKVKPATPLPLNQLPAGTNVGKKNDDDGISVDSQSVSRRSSHSLRSARSIHSAVSTRSARSATSSRVTTRSRSSSVWGPTTGKGNKRGLSIMRIQEGPFQLQTLKSPHEVDMDTLRVHELQKMERKRKTHEKKLKSKEAAEEELRRFEKLKSELAGKVYAFDESGEVILVSVPRSLPAFGNQPKIGVSDVPDEAGEPKKLRGGGAGAAGVGKAAGPREAGARASNKAGYRELGYVDLDAAPTLADQIHLNPGVSLRVGPTVKTGRLETAGGKDGSKLTFKQYNRMLSGDRADTAEAEGAARPRAVLTPTLAVPSIKVEDIVQGEGQAPDRAAAHAAKEKEKDEDPSLPVLAEIEVIGSAKGEAAPGDDHPTLSVHVSALPGDDFNTSLLSNPQWGLNPASPTEAVKALPPKQGVPAYRLASPTTKRGGPRQRPFVERSHTRGGGGGGGGGGDDTASPPKARSRLPPPIFPATSGHGFQRPAEEQTSRSASLQYPSVSHTTVRGLGPEQPISPQGKGHSSPSPRKAGFFPQTSQPAKVEMTDKAKLYFG